MEFTSDQIAAMMRELGQARYVVKLARDVYESAEYEGYVVCDTAHQDRIMSGVLGLEQAKGWAYGEHESWARRCLSRNVTMRSREFPDGTPGYDQAERHHP